MANPVQHGPSSVPVDLATTLGELRASGFRSRSVKEELRNNLIRKLEINEPMFPGIVGFEEKGRSGPGPINAGAYVLPTAMQWPATLPEKFSFEVDFLAPEIGRLTPAAYEVDGFFLDIGVPEDLDRAQTELAGFFQ